MARFQYQNESYRVPEGIREFAHEYEDAQLYAVTWVETDMTGVAHKLRSIRNCHCAEEAIDEEIGSRINQAREIAWYGCIDGYDATYKVKDEGEVLRGVEVMAIVDGAVKMYATGFKACMIEEE